MYIPNYDSFADTVDRLIVEVNKLAFYENAKRAESLKENPDLEKIVNWDRHSRDACEYRDRLKREIDRILSEIVKSKEYETLPANRTFAAPPKSVADLVAERTWEWACKKEFIESLCQSLKEEK